MITTPIQERKARSDLMLEAGISPVHDYEGNYIIKSQNSNKKYKTTISSCSCLDNKEGYVCKHILLLKKHLDKQNPKTKEKCLKCLRSELAVSGIVFFILSIVFAMEGVYYLLNGTLTELLLYLLLATVFQTLGWWIVWELEND